MSGHGMGQHVCQIPGCETTHSEIESELQTYLSGFCQVNRERYCTDLFWLMEK